MSNPPKSVPEVSGAVAAAPGGSSAPPSASPPAPGKRSPLPKIIGGIVLISGLIYAVYSFQRSYHFQSTDDAFIEGRITNISAKISNQVTNLAVDDNQVVKEGDLLMELDSRDYQNALDEAVANSIKAKSDLERMNQLSKSQSISLADMDADVANEGVAQARLKQAKLNLEYSKVLAPVPGRITRRTVEKGNYVQVGQTLLSIVQPDLWVIANFKETQLANMKVGQKVSIYIDALGTTLHGHVDSFQPGTGAQFSLLPAENATGNYVKVVQRVPVKILFDESPEKLQMLAPGLSVQPEVTIE